MVYELGSGGVMHVEHPKLSYGEMVELSKVYPIERSDHIGNLHPAALITVTDPNVSGCQILVDSNNGDDREYFPRHLIFQGTKTPMAPASRGTMVVRHLVAEPSKENQSVLAATTAQLGLPSITVGDSLVDVHVRALRKVAHNTEILTNADLMARNPEASLAMMGFLLANKALKRSVGKDGRIAENVPEIDDLRAEGVYGIDDTTPLDQGVMLPLPGILALDIVDNAARGQDKLYHQAGCDMRIYTHNRPLMELVALTVGAGLRAANIKEAPLYAVLDTANLANIVQAMDGPTANSQYDAQAMRSRDEFYQVEPSAYDMPIWNET